MKLTPKQKKIALFVGIGAITIAYFVYARKKNKEEAASILDYIAKLPSQVDSHLGAQQGIQSVQSIKFDPNKIIINGKKGSATDKAIRDEIVKVVMDFNKSITSYKGTDLPLFFDALKKIGNKNTFFIVDKIYKGVYKEGLFEAMEGEMALNNVLYAHLSDKTRYSIAIPFLSEGKWHPTFSTYFQNLKDY